MNDDVEITFEHPDGKIIRTVPREIYERKTLCPICCNPPAPLCFAKTDNDEVMVFDDGFSMKCRSCGIRVKFSTIDESFGGEWSVE